jgi:hypothetical protein
LRNPEVPGGAGPADHVVELNYRKDKNGTDSVAWMINGIQYVLHTIHFVPVTSADPSGHLQDAPT